MKTLEITLVRSLIGTRPNQRSTAQSLGLKKINQTVTKEATPSVIGQIETIAHLVRVVEK